MPKTVEIPPTVVNVLTGMLRTIVNDTMMEPEQWSAQILYRVNTDDMAFFLDNNKTGERYQIVGD